MPRFTATFTDEVQSFDADDWADAIEQALGHETGPGHLRSLVEDEAEVEEVVIRHSIFRPLLVVHDDGKVSFDFGDSYDGTYEGDGDDQPVADEYGQPHVDRLDAIIGVSTTPVERLRALADAIEAQA